MINSYIVARYTLPITGTESLAMLKRICIALVAFRVSDIISTKKQQILPNGMISQDTSGATAYKTAMRQLEALKKGDIGLPDDDVSSSSAGNAFFASDNYDESYDHQIDVTEKQW